MNITFKKDKGVSRERTKLSRPVGDFGVQARDRQPNFSKTGQFQDPQSKRNEDTLTGKIIDGIVKASIYLTVFLLPLFFLSNVPSVLELNKQVFLVVVTGIGFLAWVGKMAWKNEIRFKKDFILVPVVTFLGILGLSTVLSSYVEQSMWGFFGGEGKSFVTMLFLVALFLLIFNTVRTKSEALKVVLIFLASGFLVALYGILQVWGVFVLPAEATKVPFFNTIGSVYIYSGYVAALFLLTLALFLGDVSKVLKIVLITLSFFFFFILMVVNFKIVWVGLIICIALLFGVTIMKGGASDSQSRVLPMIFLVLTLLMILRKQPIIKKELPVEVLLSYRSSIKITLDSFRKNPLLGSGPTTYSNVYQSSRPDNLGDFWAVNFNDGTSYFLTLAATTGILGTLSFLFLVVTGIVYLFRTMVKSVSQKTKDEKDYIAIGIGIVWLFTTIMLFGYLANISLLLLWWFSLALFLSFTLLDSSAKTKEFVSTSATPKSSLAFSFVFVLVIIGFVAAIYLQSQKYIASAYFSKALAADARGDSVENVSEYIGKAIQFDPQRDIYYRNLSVAMFALANKRVAENIEEKLSSEDTSYVSNMIRGAINAAEQSRNLDRSNPENHLAVASVYEGILVTMEGADKKAIECYQEALDIDATNPALYQRLASIYIALSDLETIKEREKNPAASNSELSDESLKYLALAKDALEKAIKIKPDFASANLLVAGIYEREGSIEKAIEKEKENKAMYQNAPGVAFRLGLLYYKNEQFDNAKTEFEEAVAMDKDYANALYFLGLVLDKQGNKAGAIEKFEKVSSLNPENEDVKTIISNLRGGKAALAGFENSSASNNPPVSERSSSQNEAQSQPNINPEVEPQEIPQEAVPSLEELEEQPEQ